MDPGFSDFCSRWSRLSQYLCNHVHQRRDMHTDTLAPNACPVTTRSWFCFETVN